MSAEIISLRPLRPGLPQQSLPTVQEIRGTKNRLAVMLFTELSKVVRP